MPKISHQRAEEIERLRPVLDVLNGVYGHLQMLRDIREIEGKDPLNDDPDAYFLYVNAGHRLRETLTRWVEKWRGRAPAGDEDRENYVAEYIYGNRELREEFLRITKQLGMAGGVFRELLLFQPREHISDDQRLKFQIGLFSYMFETGFLGSYSGTLEFAMTFFNSNDPILGAEAEAIHLFVILLRSELSSKLCRCPAAGCGKFFLNLGGRREFCSRSHAQQRINRRVLQDLKQTRDKRKKEALARANEALRECKKRDWKQWLAKRTGLTTTFLTRNIKHLKVPKREEQ